MLTEQDIQLIGSVVEKKLDKFDEKVDRLDEKLDRLEERIERKLDEKLDTKFEAFAMSIQKSFQEVYLRLDRIENHFEKRMMLVETDVQLIKKVVSI